MISPMGQRQIHQTAAVETVRQAMDGALQVQREQARRQAFDAKLAEAMTDVADVAEMDQLKLADQGEHRGSAKQDQGTGASEDLPGDTDDSPAGGAGPHLDLLA
jgi:hypothetical protein